MDLRICKLCKTLRQRIADGRYPNSKNKRFRDDKNRLWSGNVCGECNQERIRQIMEKKRKGQE